jgi:hypothetical protein
VASQQQQITELLTLVRASQQQASPSAARASSAVLNYSRMEGRPSACASVRLSGSTHHPEAEIVGRVCSPSYPPRVTHAEPPPLMRTAAVPTALRDEIEKICLDILASRLVMMDERVAMSAADRVRRVTHEHVLSSVDRCVRRVLRDAVLDQSHPLSSLLTSFKREAGDERRWRGDASEGKTRFRPTSVSAHRREELRDSTAAASSQRLQPCAEHTNTESSGQAKPISAALHENDRGGDSSGDESSSCSDLFNSRGLEADIAARAAHSQKLTAIADSKKAAASASSSTEASSTSAWLDSHGPAAGSPATLLSTQRPRGDGLNVSDAAGGGRQQMAHSTGRNDVVSSIARLRQLVETLELAE